MINQYDVIVVGAGPAGLAAALQAGRAGARCLLVEKTGLLGGTTTTGGVNFPGLFHAWGKQIIAGVGWELVSRAVREFDGKFPDFSDDDRPHHHRQIWVDRFTYAAVADAMIREANVDVLLHAMPQRANWSDEYLEWKLEIACKEGPYAVSAKVVVDATGDANLTSLAGYAVRRRRTTQPGTLVFRAEGYQFESLNISELIVEAHKAIENGELLATDLGGSAETLRILLSNHGENILHIPGIQADTSAGKTEAEIKARAALLRVQRFLRRQVGLESFHIPYFAPECGIRETVTIDGEVEVTREDYISGRVWEDAVCYSFYPIDVHEENGSGIDTRPLPRGVVPTIPLRALLPKGSTQFLAVGRIACGDKEAHSAFRVQASCMAMGQAAGAVAASAVRDGVPIRSVNRLSLAQLMKQHGAIFPTTVVNDPLASVVVHKIV